ncbi:MAG: lipase maturation factor family protein, partial [Planctomycetota bacterium]|nr:lipase maturation factor family protein [Planctomycetota bacterium]
AYRFVAEHRDGIDRTEKYAFGFAERSHFLSRWLFIRILGLVYFAAFVSLWTQIRGLVGRDGILPAQGFLDAVHEQLGPDAFLRLPTLAWLNANDTALVAMCACGAGMSLLVVLRLAPALLLAVLWCLYLSLTGVSQIFLGYQWDGLLLEVGFLAIFLAPWTLRPTLGTEPAASRLVLWLLRWLLFRLMFASGIVKLLSADPVWWDLSAVTVHYETQPLPTWIAWYAFQWPAWLHQVSCAIMFVIEIAAPLLIFLSGRARTFAFFPLVLLQVLIALTGNYTFFNLLTFALCILLLDDAFLRRVLPKRLVGPTESGGPRRLRHSLQGLITVPLAALILLVSAVQFFGRFGSRTDPTPAVADLMRHVAPFRSVNTYGLFSNMTTSRPEIVIEGSNDAKNWTEYEFKWKPGNTQRRPAFVAPHQPRLDWQMWFAALGSRGSRQVVQNLMIRILEGSPRVLALLDDNPFPEAPPRFIRASLYDYRFTNRETRAATGDWWKRTYLGPYSRVFARGVQR